MGTLTNLPCLFLMNSKETISLSLCKKLIELKTAIQKVANELDVNQYKLNKMNLFDCSIMSGAGQPNGAVNSAGGGFHECFHACMINILTKQVYRLN